jgi:LuxR family maltose regulon positive regulatory protein
VSTPLLTTKLYFPPLRKKLVHRPRLLERLNRGLERRLTLVCAPAGFGKTTLIAEWVRGIKRPVAWRSLYTSDDDVERFWCYFAAALQTVESEAGDAKPITPDGNRRQPLAPDTYVTALINEIAYLSTCVIVVLDDYHTIGDRAIHEGLGFLLEHQPAQMHLVIATREDPPLPLARLRGRAQMTELRAGDLRFTSSEAARFLNQEMKLDLSPEEVNALESKTEGWITGLQLAALSLQEHREPSEFIRRFAGDDRLVVDYLVDEVLARQSENVQELLLQTSILERLCGPLCDSVVYGDASRGTSQALLERLEQDNLSVVPLDSRREWYRYHNLFADLLRGRLRFAQRQGALELHQRASQWFEDNAYRHDAVSHALAASDFGRAARLIGRYSGQMLCVGDTVMLQKWLRRLPEEQIRSRPGLCMVYAWNLLLSHPSLPPQEVERWIELAESAVESSSLSEQEKTARTHEADSAGDRWDRRRKNSSVPNAAGHEYQSRSVFRKAKGHKKGAFSWSM